MKLTPKHDKWVNLLLVAGTESCDTDSWPMVQELQFRHYRSVLDPEFGAVAAAILFGRHCGSVVEFEGVRLGIDAARAVRAIVPNVEELLPIDGGKREIGQGVATLIVGEAARLLDGNGKTGRVGKSARAVTWSGDFVGRHRDSRRYVGGDVFTNAALIAGSTEVSAALALLIGGRGLRDIYVPPPTKAEARDFDRIAAGLEFLSVKLRRL